MRMGCHWADGLEPPSWLGGIPNWLSPQDHTEGAAHQTDYISHFSSARKREGDGVLCQLQRIVRVTAVQECLDIGDFHPLVG